jgi:hypothetical protein
MPDVKIFNGATWQSIVGPPGPTAVSVDVPNCSRLGSDGLIYTPALPLSGGTVTGVTAFQQAVTFQSTVSAVGAAAVFVIDNTTNAASARRATISVQADGKFVLATTDDAGTTIQTRLELDRSGNVRTYGGTIGTLAAGQSSAAEAAEDFVVGNKGMLSHGVVNLEGATAVLNVSNAAGQLNIQSKNGATGVVGCSYRIQAQTTGVFRIFDVAVGTNRVSWAADGTMTHPGNTAFQGAANTFRQASINSTAFGPMQFVAVGAYQQRRVASADVGKVFLVTGNGESYITLAADPSIPVGSVIEVLNLSTGIVKLKADASTFLFYNVRNTYFGNSNVEIEFSGRNTSARLIKTADNAWVAIGDLANPIE